MPFYLPFLWIHPKTSIIVTKEKTSGIRVLTWLSLGNKGTDISSCLYHPWTGNKPLVPTHAAEPWVAVSTTQESSSTETELRTPGLLVPAESAIKGPQFVFSLVPCVSFFLFFFQEAKLLLFTMASHKCQHVVRNQNVSTLSVMINLYPYRDRSYNSIHLPKCILYKNKNVWCTPGGSGL